MSTFRRGIMMARQATPIQYLTAWRLVGNSEVHGTEIWSCGELSTTDNKYHIYVQSNGKVFDIALTEPLRKVNSVADKIEFADSVATVTRYFAYVADISTLNFKQVSGQTRFYSKIISDCKPRTESVGILNTLYECDLSTTWIEGKISISNGLEFAIQDANYDNITDFNAHISGSPLIYELATPTTETITVPEIEVSSTDTYTQIISQGAKAVAWTSFTPNPE